MQGLNHESIFIIGEDLKQIVTLIHSRIHKEQRKMKKEEARGVQRQRTNCKNSRKSAN